MSAVEIVCPRCKGYGTLMDVKSGIGSLIACDDCNGRGSFTFDSGDFASQSQPEDTQEDGNADDATAS